MRELSTNEKPESAPLDEEYLRSLVVNAIAVALERRPEDIVPTIKLDDLGVDSHALTEIFLDLEGELGREFAGPEIEALSKADTVGDVIEILVFAGRQKP